MPTRLLPHAILASLLAASTLPCRAELTIEQAVAEAGAKYPSVRVSLEQASAAAAAINLARTAFLPRADLISQLNRSTHNNVFGLTLPNSGLPSISGPVLRTNSLENVWGSAVGLVVQWEPFDFGRRQAGVAIAQATRDRVTAQVAVSRLEASAAAADAYLGVLAAQQTVTAAEAGVERARVLNRIVAALVKAELRPGADESRTRAELALAETRLIQARQAVAVSRATLSQMLGVPPDTIAVVAGRLLDAPPSAASPAPGAAAHPSALVAKAAVTEGEARQEALRRAWRPRFTLESALYARGTGIQPDGSTGNAASGLGPNIQNWGVGMNVTFPLAELPSLRARREIERAHIRTEQARYQQTVREIDGQTARAQAILEGSRLVAAQTPIQLEAARATEQQATARYRSGLGTLVEVAEAQRLHTQTEIDDSLARLSVWRALLGLAVAQGDLSAFVQSTR